MNDAALDSMLASLNPSPDAELTAGPRTSLHEIAGRARARQRRRRAVLGGPLLVGGVLATTAAAYALSGQSSAPAETINVACTAYISGDVITGVLADGPDPVEQCARVWRAGQMRQGVTTAPALSACVTGGRVTVYPAADACQVLGEHPFSGYTPEQTSAISLNTSLRQLFESSTCQTPAVARVRVQVLLAQQGITGWTVAGTGTTGCAGFRLNLSDHSITVAN